MSDQQLTPDQSARLARMVRLTDLMTRDRDIRTMVHATCEQREVVSVGHLANEHPDVFDELFEAAEDLLEQTPTEESMRFLR